MIFSWHYSLLFVGTLFAIGLFRRIIMKLGWFEAINHRSLHTGAIPKSAGLIFISAWALWLLLTNIHLLGLFVIPTLFLMAIGYLDDLYSLSPKVRLCLQLVTASYFIYCLPVKMPLDFIYFSFTATWLIIPLLIILLLWFINLFNFMDGADGYAAGETFFYLIGCTSFFISAHDWAMLNHVVALAMVLLSFLVWNFPPAKIFMGDSGSISLGFLVSSIAIYAQVRDHLSILYPMMLLGLFWFDATITVARRLLAKQKLSEAHRLHAYQRYILSGKKKSQLLGWGLLINIIITGLTLSAYYYPNWIGLFLSIEMLLLTFLYYRVEQLYPFKV